jgi:Tol biopolymer transport system component/DNA-binding winged helix-turn-helix (wHTH) protein
MSNKTLTLYKFEDFSLDTNQRKLFFQETLVPLTPKAFQTLLVLLKNRHQVVEKEFLLNEVWTDTFVEETTLSQNILTLRKTLGSFQKDKEFIVTFPRRGFRFVADVQEVVSDEEILVIERSTRTHIVAEQHEIHDSQDSTNAVNIRQTSLTKHLIRSRTISLICIGLICAILGAATTWYFLKSSKNSPSQKARLNTLISDSTIRNAVVAPNGKYLALMKERDGIQSLWISQIGTNTRFELVNKLNGVFLGLTFSPDGEEIYYSVAENGVGMLYKVPLLGGASQMILKNIESSVAISPDNKFLAFVRKTPQNKQNNLIISEIDGKNERIIEIQNADLSLTNQGAAWSPDGKNISVTVNSQSNQKTTQIAVVSTENGSQKLLTNENWSWAGQPVWEKEGNGLIVPAFRQNSPTVSDELWRISYPDGKAEYLTSGIKGKLGISLNSASNTITALKTERLTCFLSASLDNFRKSNLISTRVGDTCHFPIGADWTNEGKILYSATESGNADIWTIDENGGEKRQLTSDESAEISPKLSKDGKYLIFLSNRSGKMNVWRANANGTNPIQLTNNENVKETIISPDGTTVFYTVQANESDAETLWKISINGENNQQITTKTTKSPRISPDGKTIAAFYPASENKMSVSLLSPETGEVVKKLETPPNEDLPFLDWANNGENLFLILRNQSVHSIWKLNIANNKTEKIREWENDAIFRFVVSKDGEKVFYEVGTEMNSVLQIDLTGASEY